MINKQTKLRRTNMGKQLLSLLAIVIAIAFVSNNLFAQDSTKTKQKGSENAVQTKSEFKMETPNKGETTQPKYMNTHRVRVEEGKGTMTREELQGEAKSLQLKGEGKSEGGTALKKMNKKSGSEKSSGNKYGPGDGTGTGIGPKDGTGYGPGTTGGTTTGTKRGSRK